MIISDYKRGSRWAKQNPGKHRAYVRKWRREHPNETRAQFRKWAISHPERRIYQAAKKRCTNPNASDWRNYGGRGIKFLFESFDQFFAELGPRPKGLTLERINNEGHYEIGNVRWATQSEQARNKRKQHDCK